MGGVAAAVATLIHAREACWIPAFAIMTELLVESPSPFPCSGVRRIRAVLDGLPCSRRMASECSLALNRTLKGEGILSSSGERSSHELYRLPADAVRKSPYPPFF